MTVLFLVMLMCFSIPAHAVSLGGEEKKVAGRIMNCIKTSKNRVDLVSIPGYKSVNTDAIERYVDEKCGRYYRITTCSYSPEWRGDSWFDGFYVYTREAKALYNYNTMLEKKAKKIVKRYTNKRMSKKAKAKALAKGVAKYLSYRDFDENNWEVTLSNNLKKNKGVCCTYAQLYQACCDRAKIRCEFVYGYADGGFHSWNRVRIGGKWRYVDVTWYDCTKQSKYILKSRQWRSHRTQGAVTVYG